MIAFSHQAIEAPTSRTINSKPAAQSHRNHQLARSGTVQRFPFNP
jgi:hypothetical protein